MTPAAFRDRVCAARVAARPLQGFKALCIVAPALVAVLGMASCATPRVRPVDTIAIAPIVTSQGSLPSGAGERVVDTRLGQQADDARVQELVEAFREQAATPLVAGNRVSLLIDGPETLEAISEAIEAARHHVHIETYIFADDEIGREFRDLLIKRRGEGVEIRVIYDAIGSVTTPPAFFDVMRAAGIEVRPFRPLDPVRTPLPWKINNRDHRKIVVVDGRIAFTGGINISSTYASASTVRPGPQQGRDEAWRDTHVRIEGPVASQFQSLFLATWARAGGKLDTEAPADPYHPLVEPAGAELVAAVATDGDDASEATIYGTYMATIRHASRRLWITQAYFAPNKEMRRAFIEAAQRGVDVRLIVPGFTDSGLIFHASRASYDELLKGGVRIYEQPHALLHAKTAVADGALSMVGSANLDMRSFLHNNEVNAVIVGSDFARRMEAVFERDLRASRELDLEQWRKRPLGDKLKELGSKALSYWL
jgi:cardiolipin synthase